MKIRPLYDRLLIRREKAAETVGESMLVIPDAAKEQPLEATILALGDGKWDAETRTYQPCPLTVGTKILVGTFAGIRIMIDGEELTIIREDEILAVVVSE